MKLKFKFGEIIETEIYSGFYEIHILGGFDVKTNPDFYVQIINIDTEEDIELKEKEFKARDYKEKKRAVKFYSFEITKYGKYRISTHNYEDIIVKRDMPSLLPFIFDSFLFRLLTLRGMNSVVDKNELEILIS